MTNTIGVHFRIAQPKDALAWAVTRLLIFIFVYLIYHLERDKYSNGNPY